MEPLYICLLCLFRRIEAHFVFTFVDKLHLNIVILEQLLVLRVCSCETDSTDLGDRILKLRVTVHQKVEATVERIILRVCDQRYSKIMGFGPEHITNYLSLDDR